MNIRSEVKRFFIYGFGTISGSLLNFLLIPLYFNKYTTAEYGVINILLMFITFTSMFVSAGMMSAMQKYYFDVSINERKVVVGTIFIWYLFTVGVISFFFLLFNKTISNLFFGVSKYGRDISILAPIVFLTLFFDIPLNLLRLKKKARIFVGLSLVRLCIDAVLKYVFIVIFNRGISGYFDALLLSLFVSSLLGSFFVRDDIALRFKRQILKSLLQISSPYIIAGFAIWSLQSVDRVMLNFLLSESATGIYSAGLRFGQIYNLVFYRPFSALLPAVLFPFLKNSNEEKTKKFFILLMNIIFVFGTLIGACTIFISFGFIDILNNVSKIDPNYVLSKNVIPFIVCSNILYSMAIPAGYTGLHLKRTTFSAYAGISAATLNIFLNWILIKKLGVIGASVATLISFFIYIIIVYFLFNKIYKIQYNYLKIFLQSCIFILVIIIGKIVRIENAFLSVLLKTSCAILILLISAIFLTKLINMKTLLHNVKN